MATFNNSRRVRKPGQIAIYIVLGIYCLFNILLFVLLVNGSLKGQTELLVTSIWEKPESLHWENYAKAWSIGHIADYMLNSIILTSFSVIIALILSSMSAYILGRIRFKLSGLTMAFIMIGMMLPDFVIVIPLFDLLNSVGLINSLLGLTIIYISKLLPFSIFVLTSFYKNLPYELEEAAIIDGASPVRIFAQIMMPLTGPAIVAVAINDILKIWNEFLNALIFLGKKQNYSLPIGLFNLNQAATYSSNWTMLFAGMLISAVPVMIVFALFQKQFAEGVSAGAIKG